MVLVAGEAGIGKSSLVEAFVDGLDETRVAWCACDGAFTPSALGPLQDVADQWGGAVRVACADGVPRDTRFAALLSMLREHGEHGEQGGLSVLVVEDLHFADEATLDLLGYLARRLRGVRALVVATYRDDGLAENRALRETIGEASTQRWTRRIALPPLTAAGRRRAEPRHRPRAGGRARPHRRQPVLRHRGAQRDPRRAADVSPRRRARPGRPPLGGRSRVCSTPRALVGERVEPDLLARRHRRRTSASSTSPSPPACSSPTGRCCGSATRSPAGPSSRRSARTRAADVHRRILAGAGGRPESTTTPGWRTTPTVRSTGPPPSATPARAADRSAAAGVAARGRRGHPALGADTRLASAGERSETSRKLGNRSPGMGSRYRSAAPLAVPRFVVVKR